MMQDDKWKLKLVKHFSLPFFKKESLHHIYYLKFEENASLKILLHKLVQMKWMLKRVYELSLSEKMVLMQEDYEKNGFYFYVERFLIHFMVVPPNPKSEIGLMCGRHVYL